MKARGLQLSPRFAQSLHRHPYSDVKWETRDVEIKDVSGKVIFEQKNVEVPKTWSQLALQVTASKYFRGTLGTEERERSVAGLISRVVSTIASWGQKDGYFADHDSRMAFEYDLTHLMVNQCAAFNSPVWFNVGAEKEPQCSACFINSVDDSMESILDLVKTEGMLFKYGSGTGSNLSSLRAANELLRGGGTASGPISFMKGFDAFAGAIKSGGKTRRAAKMVILNHDHPDILKFIETKMAAERAAHALVAAGFSSEFNSDGGAYDMVPFQNANHSVRVTDEFMAMVTNGKESERFYDTHAVTAHESPVLDSHDVFNRIAEAAWQCGDPGIQFDTTINQWHMCLDTSRINASNPCSEYMFVDDSACNLASINLMKFRKEDGTFDVVQFGHAVDVMILAMEIIVGNSSYPTQKIAENSHWYRPLGLGYANLGALLMSSGLPYDSDVGRAYAASITAFMHSRAYAQSTRIARDYGACDAWLDNKMSAITVLTLHREALDEIELPGPLQAPNVIQQNIIELHHAAVGESQFVCDSAKQYGVRNMQVTVLAPTGTIGFMMDCDTTGIEPDIALVKHKKLVGGGTLKYVNTSIPLALEFLGYSPARIKLICKHVEDNGTIELCPDLKPEHLPIFDCALAPAKGSRLISWEGHIRMMAAVQPFLSGAISKTVNMPESATIDDVKQAYIMAWQLGLKALAIYRDGCKKSQPLSTGEKKREQEPVPVVSVADYERVISERNALRAQVDRLLTQLKSAEAPTQAAGPKREKLPKRRQGWTEAFRIANHKGYMHVGEYPDGRFGEVFIDMAKDGSVVKGLAGALAAAVSIGVQYGVPLATFVEKFAHTAFEPSGFTGDTEIPRASSIIDYVFRKLGNRYLSAGASTEAPAPAAEVTAERNMVAPSNVQQMYGDAPPCDTCGTLMVRNGACHKCPNCGSTSGCS